MEGSASPRKPKVVMPSRSSTQAILLVACREMAIGSSSAAIPHPSSRTRMSPVPPRSTSTSMRCAPASRLFSTSSLTTEAGRSITSPAAIWSISSSGRTRMAMRESMRKLARGRQVGRALARDGYDGGGGAGQHRGGRRVLMREARAGWRVLLEVGAQAREDRLRKQILLALRAQPALLVGIGDVGGLDEHRGNVGRLEHHEGRLLHQGLSDHPDSLQGG